MVSVIYGTHMSDAEGADGRAEQRADNGDCKCHPLQWLAYKRPFHRAVRSVGGDTAIIIIISQKCNMKFSTDINMIIYSIRISIVY